MHKLFSALLFFIGLTAIAGGLTLILTHGMGMPQEWLSNSPLPSYLLLGLILALVVGGSYVVAAAAVWNRSAWSPEASATAGFALIIWIFTEVSIIREGSWLQPFYFAVGVLTLILTMLGLKYGRTRSSQLLSQSHN